LRLNYAIVVNIGVSGYIFSGNQKPLKKWGVTEKPNE